MTVNAFRMPFFQKTGKPHAQEKPVVLFGWGTRSGQHHAVDSAAITLLPASSLQGLLLTPLAEDTIERRSISLDQQPEPNSRSHFTRIDTRGKKSKVYKDSRRAFCDFPLVGAKEALNKRNVGQRIDWRLLEHCRNEDPEKQDNVVFNTLWAYNRLTDTFKQLKDSPQNIPHDALLEQIADLLHYSADMCQPLHETTYGDWKLRFPYREKIKGSERQPLTHAASVNNTDEDNERYFTTTSIHAFMESSAIDFHFRLPKRNEHNPPPSQEGVQQRLVDEAKFAYSTIKKILEADFRARNRGYYLDNLPETLKPIVDQQLQRSAVLASDLLWWSYLAGGQPDLSSLPE